MAVCDDESIIVEVITSYIRLLYWLFIFSFLYINKFIWIIMIIYRVIFSKNFKEGVPYEDKL